jgi:organic radical activating enzyme
MGDRHLPVPHSAGLEVEQPMSDFFSSSVQFMGTGPEPVFRTIQGEGIRLGRLSTFVRFYGCNQTCEWCDTKQSWKPGPGGGVPVIATSHGRNESGNFSWEDPAGGSVVSMYAYHSGSDPMDLVITGGNPMLPDHREAVSWLAERWPGDITIETNAYGKGTLPDTGLIRAFASSRTVRSVLWSLSPKIMDWDDHTVSEYVRCGISMGHEIQLKLVVSNLSQAKNIFARIYALNVPNAALSRVVVVLQPEWSVTRTLVPELLASNIPLLQHFADFKDVRVIPQVHKSLRIL